MPYPTRESIPGFETVRSMLRILKVGFPEQQLASLLDYLSRQAFLETNIHNSLAVVLFHAKVDGLLKLG